MANMRAIRTRIKSLESTQQITKSMKMVAASKLRRTQNAYAKLNMFAEKTYEILEEVIGCMEIGDNPLLVAREERKTVCYVLLVGNRGLCGAYNQALLRYLTEQAEQEPRESFLVVCGRWGRESLHKAGVRIERCFDQISDTPTSADARELTAYLKELYLSGQADEIVLVYQQYKSVLLQTPGMKQLLPVIPEYGLTEGREYIFEPDETMLLDRLVELYLSNTVYAAMLEAKTSEHSARMTAMTAASDNTDELIGQLQLDLNHARQAAITTEISEISGGAAVLHKDKH